MNIKAVLVSFLLLCACSISAQRQANHWHFGDSISVNFTSGSPQLDPPSSMMAIEGSAAQSDAMGNLLFYTNGGGYPSSFSDNTGFIWNRDHQVMYNMEGIEGGNTNAEQSAIIFPVPEDDSSRYYVFTMEEIDFMIGGDPADQPEGRGLSYFIVDMNLNNGLGGVALADQRVFTPAYEGLTAIAMRGQTEGYWVITHTQGNSWVVVPVTAEGVGEPVVYPLELGEVIEEEIKGSPDGNWLIAAQKLFVFDPVTGVPATSPTFSFGSITSASFTPNSRHVYAFRSSVVGNALIRFDIYSPDIEGSASTLSIIEPSTRTYQMEMGPNGSLYFLEGVPSQEIYGLSEITCPSTAQPMLNRSVLEFTDVENPLAGLPNYPPDIFETLASQDDTLVIFNDTTTICPQDDATFVALNLGDTFNWSTGSTDNLITVNTPGNYSVTITGGCQVSIENFVLNVLNDTIRIISDSFLVCPQTEVQLIPQTEGMVYAWSNGSDAQFIQVSEPGNYDVTITGDCQPKVESFLVENLLEIDGDITFLSDTNLRCPGQDTLLLSYSSNLPPNLVSWTVTNIGTSDEFTVTNDSLLLPIGEQAQNIELVLQGDCGIIRRFYSLSPAPPIDPTTIELNVDAPERLCPGDRVSITVEGVTNEVAVFWEDGSMGGTRIIGSADSSTSYFATLVNDCNDSLRLDVPLDYSNCPIECMASIPELITPNDDGVNDRFNLFSNCLNQVETYKLLVFNRWGQLVFESENPDDGWDGTTKGEIQPMDVYLYRISYKFRDEDEVRQQDGQFSLVR